jgi:RNase P subunit RPR2
MAEKKRTFPITIIVFTVFFLSSILVSNSSLSKAPSITSSKNCKECHQEIYNHWKNAMHSMSIEDPIFKASYMEAYFKTAGEAKYNCLRCHAPIAFINNDYDLKNEITKEGVNCDFCHSIKKVNLDNKDNPFELEIGEIKRGPLSDVESPAHKTESSALFQSSELCAGCHEYTNRNGVKVLGTYSEWRESPYAEEGTHCQNCHMPLIPGKIVKSEIKSSNRKQINLHAISASHSTEQLRKALKVKIRNINKEEGIVEVVVGVSNVGSGHMVPTGIPSRKLILLVELKTPNEYFSQQRIYQKIMLDESGKEIKKENEVFQKAAQVSFDNRLRPRETRIERFAFAMPKNKNITISARVEYLYKASVLRPTEIRVKMAEDIKSISK